MRSRTDWARVDALADKDIDLTDLPEVTAAMFSGAHVRRAMSGRKPMTPTQFTQETEMSRIETIAAINEAIAILRAGRDAEAKRLDAAGQWESGANARADSFEREAQLCEALARADPSVLVGAATGALDDGPS